MASKRITHGELKDGDRIWNSGVLFEARNVQIEHGNVIRYTGVIVEGGEDIRHTGYNGGRYGAYAHVACTIEL